MQPFIVSHGSAYFSDTMASFWSQDVLSSLQFVSVLLGNILKKLLGDQKPQLFYTSVSHHSSEVQTGCIFIHRCTSQLFAVG